MSIKRIMIIVWGWLDIENRKQLTGLEDMTWDEAIIEGQEDDLIIRVNEEESKAAKQLLYSLVERFPKAEIFIFLHRNHNYHYEDAKEIMHHVRVNQTNKQMVKVFLFSGGRDYLYYNIANEGLLNQIGNFMVDYEYTYWDINEKGKKIQKTEEVEVAKYDRKRKKWVVFPRHFNRVWRYYQHEFKKKINSLHIELMNFLVEIPSADGNQTAIPLKIWHDKIAEEPNLHWRVKNFLNLYEAASLSKLPSPKKEEWKAEFRKLQSLERDKEISMVFDDCNANLSEMGNGSGDYYQELREALLPIFQENRDGYPCLSLIQIHQLFTNLLQSLPD